MMNLNIQLTRSPSKLKKREVKENTTLKRLISQCLNRRDQNSFGSLFTKNNIYSVKQLWENPTFKLIKKLGIEFYLDQVISKGSCLCPEAIVIISGALRDVQGISEKLRLKVTLQCRLFWRSAN